MESHACLASSLKKITGLSTEEASLSLWKDLLQHCLPEPESSAGAWAGCAPAHGLLTTAFLQLWHKNPADSGGVAKTQAQIAMPGMVETRQIKQPIDAPAFRYS